jgi:hypothetical protein
MSTKNFEAACTTYRLLRDLGYPEKATLKLVADRHRLSKVQRNCLYRGVVSSAHAAARKAKIVDAALVEGELLGVDWYNVLITVESYLKGQVVFLCDDGILRDSSGVHGSYRPTELTQRARDQILSCIHGMNPRHVDVYLDSPLAFSGVMATEIRDLLQGAVFPSNVLLAHSADYPLKSHTGIVASSDSIVIDAASRIIDLARCVLERAFAFKAPALHELFPSSPEAPSQSPGT